VWCSFLEDKTTAPAMVERNATIAAAEGGS
jgi:hypothetical protein